MLALAVFTVAAPAPRARNSAKEACPPPLNPSAISSWEDGCAALANCSGHGVCWDGAQIAAPSELPCAASYTTAACLCATGYKGSTCGEATCANGCSGRGVCVKCDTPPSIAEALSPNPLATPGYRCVCDAGYVGADCGDRECPAGCSSHGKCVGGTHCECDAGWSGPDCAAPT